MWARRVALHNLDFNALVSENPVFTLKAQATAKPKVIISVSVWLVILTFFFNWNTHFG